MLPPERDTRGILRPTVGLQRFTLDRRPPAAALVSLVDWYWVVSWDLPAGETHDQEVVPLAAVNLSFRDGHGLVNGVQRTRQVRHLEGRGCVVAAKFRPAGFRPFVSGPLTRLTDRIVDAAEVLGPRAGAAAAAIAATDDADAQVEAVQDLLLGFGPVADRQTDLVNDAVDHVAADPQVTRVDQLAAEVGIGARRLQRLFADHVGVSPKWVIRRARLQDAAERVARGEQVNWADVAADLGYADQAHLTRAFTATIGLPPDRYAKQCAASAVEVVRG